MYSLFRLVSTRQLLLEQAPLLAVSILIAELFYKFGSFTLECIAFLATWALVDALFYGLLKFRKALTIDQS